MNELAKRIFFAVPAATIVLWATWMGEWYFLAMAIVLMLFLQYEMNRLARNAGFQPDSFFPYTIGLFILLVPLLPYPFEIGIVIFLAFVVLQVFKKSETHLQKFISTFFCSIYIPFGLLCILLIRDAGTNETGFVLTIALLLMIWGNDVFAYLGGKKWGRHLLAADISPSKTWEGFAFGFLGAGAGLFLTISLVPLELQFTRLLLLPAVVIVSIFGPMGDLIESKLKRAAEVKDSSDILPGHGGFFDRMDAIILAAPPFYLYIRYLQITGVFLF